MILVMQLVISDHRHKDIIGIQKGRHVIENSLGQFLGKQVSIGNCSTGVSF